VGHRIKTFILFIFIFSGLENIIAQCDYTNDLPIVDESSFTVDFLVSGAADNELGVDNCLKIVTTYFDHDFVSDLNLSLESPAGNIVELVGVDVDGNSTGLVNSWDIQFYNRDELVAVPDLDYDQIWNSNPTGGWVGFTTYTGSYYPYQGGLEDFTGSVNGIWKLHISDNSQFGEGVFSCFGLEFCNDEDIEVSTCSTINHTLEEDDVSSCRGSEELDISVEPNLEDTFDNTVYGYQYILFGESGFQNLTQSTDFTNSPSGTYTLCGIYYFLDDLVDLEGIAVGSDLASIQAYIIDNRICATTSDDCINIEILDVAEIVIDTMVVCQGDTVSIGGEIYTESGMYEIITPSFPCDSISMLDLEVSSFDIAINANSLELSCNNDTIQLDAGDTNLTGVTSFTWKTEDGNIISQPNQVQIDVNSGGVYIFEVVANECTYTSEIEVTEDVDFVAVDLLVENITCTLDSALVQLTASDEISDLTWVGDESTFRRIGDDILVGTAGTFLLDFVTEFGCLVSREITVENTRIEPNFELYGDTLTCKEPIVTIGTVNADTLNSTFFWIKDDEVLGMDTFLMIDRPGLYNLRVRSGAGCVDSFEIDIFSEIDTLNAELFGGELSCEQTELTIAYSSTIGGLDPLWILPNGVPVVDSAFVTSLAGDYMLTLEDEKSCTLDTVLVITEDTRIPEIDIPLQNFQCGQDSLQINSSVNIENVSYHWTSESGFSDTTSMPWVFAPGEYMVEVCLVNGCCTIDTFTVGVDSDLPIVTFEFGNLDCTNDTVYIIPSDTSTYDMAWFLDGAALSVDSNIIEVVMPGLYEVVVTNPSNGCSSNYSFDIMEDKISSLNELSTNILNCEVDVVQISLDAERQFESFSWTGPGLLDTNEEPLVDAAGLYFINYTFENGCTGIDSIEVFDEGELPNLVGTDTVYNCFSPTLLLNVTYESATINITWEGENFLANGDSVLISEPGLYNVYAVSPGLCRDTVQINVAADTISPVLSIVNDGIITCADSTVQVTLTVDTNTTSYTFGGPGIINQNELVIEVDQPGIYTAVGMADNGCTTTKTNEVLISNDFPEYEINLDSFTCVKDEVTVGVMSPDPSLNVLWDGPISIPENTYNFSTVEAGSYSFILTNSDGCKSIDTFFVLRDTFPPEGAIALSNQITCDLDEALLSIEGNLPSWIAEWNGPGVTNSSDATITTSLVGDYTLAITATNGCVTLDTMTVVYDTVAAVIEVFGDPITCTAGKVFLNVVSDKPLIEYQWNGPSGYESTEVEPLVLEDGTYSVTVTSANGCESIGEIEIEDERAFPIIDVEDYFLPCDGAPAVVVPLTISEGAAPKWFGPNNFFVDADTALIFAPGEYVGLALTEEGCATADTFLVIDDPVLPIFSAEAEVLECFGPVEITALDVADDKSILWTGPNGYTSDIPLSMIEEPGLYVLQVTGINGCVDSTTVEVIDGRIFPNAVAENIDLFQCENIEVNLSGEGSSEGSEFTYQWSTENGGNILQGEQSLSPRIKSEGTYIIEVTNNNIGCISYDTLVLTLQEQELVDLDLLVTSPTCMGYDNGIIEIENIIGGYGPFNITVDGFDYGERLDIQYLTVGDHDVRVVDSLGCILDSLVLIDTSNLLSVTLPVDTTLIFGQMLNVLADINLPEDSISQILWSSNVPCDGCRSFDFRPDGNMTIAIEVIDVNGCVEEKEFRITVNRPDNLPFPHIFSPNGDGLNDIFYLPLVEGIESIEYIRVYDNWGGLIHESINPLLGDESSGWDGSLNGQQAAMAVYIVEAMVRLVDGTEIRYFGDVTLIR
jgi:gliding motility-associated-like protein